MRHQPDVLPPRTLAVVVVAVGRVERIERFAERSVEVAAAEKSGFGVPVTCVESGAPAEQAGILFAAQLFGRKGDAAVRQRIFQPFGDRFALLVGRDVILRAEPCESLVVAQHRPLHGFEGAVVINARKSFHNGVGNDRNRLDADHFAGVGAVQVPDGEITLLVVNVEHRIDHVGHAFGLQQRVERMRGAVGVP